ncbi:hypothetical protein PDESU_02722 [Pontiella desulfatans]|uniref:Organic solvent tolerance-like N-terminal domain-containing protein n=2 Tax=Pontiella desulfatans TaxID=2750659 RepID=A0A6C2U2N6_PONDE|nr:hypothetical protein PDESU_02722 [Pontiella desulfatans]
MPGCLLCALRDLLFIWLLSMKNVVVHILALMLVHVASAQVPPANKLDEYMETGMEVAGVRAPYYDEEGNLKAQLYGGYAKILEGGVADVTNLRIDVFEGKKVFMSLFAPQCFTRMEEKNGQKLLMVYSEGDVLIDMDQMTITGKGFRFSSAENKFEVLHNSRVVVKESAREMKGAEF